MVDEPEDEYNEDFDYADGGTEDYYEDEVQDQDPVETDH